MRGTVPLWLAALGLLAGSACAAEDTTAIDVIVGDAQALGERLDELVLDIAYIEGDREIAERFRKDAEYDGNRLRPWVVRAVPKAESHPSRVLYVFRAAGLREGAETVYTQSRLAFVRDTRLTLQLRLEAPCIGVVCPALQTCAAGACRDDLIDPCTLGDAGCDAGARADGDPSDASPARDAPLADTAPAPADASPADAAADSNVPDAGPTCGAPCGPNADCDDGVCVCQTGWQDCDGAPGCESYSAVDPEHCGRCGARCPDSARSCISGGCASCATASQCADDGNPCTGPPTCDSGACNYPIRSGASCEDGLFCTTDDRCDATGACTGAARSCADGVACTADTCDEPADRCTSTVSTGCLIAGVCVTSGAENPTNRCASCNPAASTTAYSPRPDGTTCNDNRFCSSSDRCISGMCTGDPLDCSDGQTCTTDSCNETTDRCDSAVTTGCLAGGACRTSGQLDPSNTCHICDPARSRTDWSLLPAGTVCDDGNFCTIGEECDAAARCVYSSFRNCDDFRACTFDGCYAAGAVCEHISNCSTFMEVCNLTTGSCMPCPAGRRDCDVDPTNGCECVGCSC